MLMKADNLMTRHAHSTGKMIAACCALLLLSGCLATNPDLADPVVEAKALPVIEPKPVAKDEKLLVEKNRLNKYVNQQAPSQLRYSLQVLNQADADDGIYPTIEDLSTSQDNLRTEEERRKLENELEALNR
ncbi:hypothetical protein FDK21_06770 [Cohaesibacter sp. CAU 1516]|uniref:hypothetical protein n=1 Tax=Cohaesibacter sp. CAU 1516 TaxID=2576038 RepID=UPI0010FD54B2|nr:hypothetical protein [Cohaesibacter sp. CAU 1516]TLP49301.1 hypothetical protein FDK21_06770 [Cohaesibacter sp. CAU 1516]